MKKTLLKGKLTYIIALCGLIWGMYTQDIEVILASLGAVGLRRSIK